MKTKLLLWLARVNSCSKHKNDASPTGVEINQTDGHWVIIIITPAECNLICSWHNLQTSKGLQLIGECAEMALFTNYSIISTIEAAITFITDFQEAIYALAAALSWCWK